MKRICIVGAFVSFLLCCGCTKPAHIHAGGDYDEWAPLVAETRLTDTISRSFTDTLHLEDVTGSSFRYSSGVQASYFVYRAEPNEVLDALGRLPFPLRGHAADVGYHEVSAEEWTAFRKTVGPYELSDAAFFWDADPESFFIYASVKREHHLLLIDKMQQRILHRIVSGA